MNYTYFDPRRHYRPIIGAMFFWIYSNKFLTYSVDYVTQMSRDLSFGGVQQNIAYYSIESLILLVGGFLLISYLLVQNEFSNLFSEPRKFENPPSIFFGVPWTSLRLFEIKIPQIITNLMQNLYLWVVIFGLFSILENGSFSVLSIFSALLKGSSLGLFLGLFIGFLLRGYHSSLFAMSMFLLSYFLVPLLDLSTSGIMFFLIGGSVLTSFILLQLSLIHI